MNFKKFAVLALVAIALFVATPVAAQSYLAEAQSPFWGQMNFVDDGFGRAFNGIRRAMGQPERIRQPLFDDRVVERVDPRYTDQSAYYRGRNRRPQPNVGSGWGTAPYDRSAAPCDENGNFVPQNSYQTPYNPPTGYPGQHPCQYDFASKNDMRTLKVLAGGAVGLLVLDKVKGLLSKDKKPETVDNDRLDKIEEAIELLASQRQQRGPQTAPPVQPRPVVVEPQARGEMVKVLNCTGAVLSITGKFAGEAWTLQPGESRTIETRSGLGLRATYNGHSGQIVVADANTIAVHPAN